jgi:hypothetical protein
MITGGVLCDKTELELLGSLPSPPIDMLPKPSNNAVLALHRYINTSITQPNTNALTSILSLPTAPSGVLGSSNAVCGTRPH